MGRVVSPCFSPCSFSRLFLPIEGSLPPENLEDATSQPSPSQEVGGESRNTEENLRWLKFILQHYSLEGD